MNMDTLLDAVSRLPPMVGEATAELTRVRNEAAQTIQELTLRIAGLTDDLNNNERVVKEFSRIIEGNNNHIAELTTDLARVQADAGGKETRIAELTADLAHAQTDADDKEKVIKELTGIIVEKDHRIAGLMSSGCKKKPWWRHVIPKRDKQV